MWASWPMKPAPTKPIRTFAATRLPVGDRAARMLEDGQPVRLVRVAAAELDIELDAPAGLVRQLEVAVQELERLRQQLLRPVRRIEADLERDEVRRGHRDVSRDDRVDGAERVVRREAAVVDLGHRGDCPRFENPAAM